MGSVLKFRKLPPKPAIESADHKCVVVEPARWWWQRPGLRARHTWSQWQQILVEGKNGKVYAGHTQRRSCTLCGLIEDRATEKI